MNDVPLNPHEEFDRLRKESSVATKKCFISNCNDKTIKAHSIAKSKLLAKISKNGEVMYFNYSDESDNGIALRNTGKMKATTFPGFCSKHDQVIFKSIDDANYTVGNGEQEFLFAMRACSREYTVRQAADRTIAKAMPMAREEAKDFIREYYVGFNKGTKDVEVYREIFNHSFGDQRFWRINTVPLTLNQEYPIVVSSMFKLEKDQTGKIVNNLRGAIGKPYPLFFTVFPQDGKTYCLLSWFKKDEDHYQNLRKLSASSQQSLKVLISNMISSYTENFAVNPDYWNNLPKNILSDFGQQWGRSTFSQLPIKLIEDPYLNLFL